MIKIVVRDRPHTIDRYTVIITIDKEIHFYAMSDNPFHPQGFNQYLDTVEAGTKYPNYRDGAHLGKKVPWADLSSEVKKAILKRGELT